ncbi:MAG TPA: GreA/GreB family elongation factor [Thiohalobacter sp.]|nr:GreA/GreB family elongation factor [Thiohalobacter sp.]
MSYYLRKIEQYCMLSSVNLFLSPVVLQNVLVELERLQDASGGEMDVSSVSRIGSQVRLVDLHDGAVVVFKLVLPEKSNPQHGLLSVLSPLGSAILGKKAGEKIDVSSFGFRHAYVVRNVS